MKFPLHLTQVDTFLWQFHGSLVSAKILPVGIVITNLIKLSVETVNNGYLFSAP